jgi:uroporphyrinogen decarboxylase
MTSRERWLAVLSGETPDRVPTDYWATQEVTQRLICELKTGDFDGLIKKLGIDAPAHVGPRYIGPPLQPHESPWGWRSSPVTYETGTYMECDFRPLAGLETLGELERYRWPQADWWDFSKVAEDCAKYPDRIIHSGYVSALYFYNHLRGLERSMEDLLERPEYAAYVIKRIFDFHFEYLTRLLEAARGGIHTTQVTDDFGMQEGLMISPPMFREFFKSGMKRIIDLAHSAGTYVMHHDDGAIRPLIPEFIELKIDILNPIQWRCRGMEREGLARDFGGQIVFHGGVDNQQTLPFGTPDDVRNEVAENIAIFSSGKGYILAPCHNIQPVTPTANVVALYDAAREFGRLRHAATQALA